MAESADAGWTRRMWRWGFLVFATLLGLLGAAMGVLGVWLIGLGGTAYYLLAGAGLLGGSVFAWRGRPSIALGLFGFVLAASAIWSLVEIGGKGWLPAWGFDLAGRIGLLAALTIGAGFSRVMGSPGRGTVSRRLAVGGVAGLAAGLAGLVGVSWERPTSPGSAFRAGASSGSPEAGADWLAYGGTNAGRRYSGLSQITVDNVSGLEEAWSFRSGDVNPSEGRVFYSSQNTPIKAADHLYLCTPSSRVFALDPGSGAVRWSHDPEVDPRHMESLFTAACRAVAYHDDGAAEARPEAIARMPAAPGVQGPVPRDGARCHRRVFVATADGRLIALDAVGGFVCRDFGLDGTVDMTAGMGLREPGFASNTSGATVVGDRLILGQQVSDNQRRDAPSGVVRAYDARSGALIWAWDALRPDARAALAPGEIYPRGTPNVWNIISADEALGLAFLATGNAAADQWGGNRSAEEERHTDAVVAVDLETGATRWVYTTVNHDLWDYDLGAQPMLVDVVIDGAPRRAVMQAGKTGNLFLLDAVTGTPLRPVEARPVPQGAAPGDWVAPTQPQSVFYPNVGGVPGREPERIDARSAFGLTPVDAALCRISFHRHRYEGMFTPPTVDQAGTLLFPGTVGGPNWGGLGFDPERRLIISNNSRLPNLIVLHPRDEVSDVPVGSGGARPDQAVAPHSGTPFGVTRPIWWSPLKVPCLSPPWGYITATHIDTGEIVWSRPLGTGFDVGPLGLPTFLKIALGTPNLGGPLVTAGGLTFIGAAQDDFLRAFETETGRLVWEARLPAGPQAGAMTYEHEGRQYVAITATGHGRFETTPGDYLQVFSLPNGG